MTELMSFPFDIVAAKAIRRRWEGLPNQAYIIGKEEVK